MWLSARRWSKKKLLRLTDEEKKAKRASLEKWIDKKKGKKTENARVAKSQDIPDNQSNHDSTGTDTEIHDEGCAQIKTVSDNKMKIN